MRRLLLRLAVSGFMLLIGIAASSLRHILVPRQTGPSANVPGQINAQNMVRALEDKKARGCEGEDDFTVMGRYTNFNYGYSALVPEGMMGATNSTSNGFGIDLTQPTTIAWWTNFKEFPRAYLSVDGSHNSDEVATLDDAVQQDLEFLNKKYDHSRLLAKRPTRLAGLRAVRFIVSYDEGGEAVIEDEIVAFRKDTDFVYRIELRTPASRYARDKSLITQMQKSWLTDPLPDSYPLPPVYEERK